MTVPPRKTYRKVARGTLSGFGTFSEDQGLPDPAFEGSVLLYNRADSGPTRAIFVNSASQSSRRQMRVRISYDQNAAKWDFGRELINAKVSGAGYEGGYSSMTKSGDNKIGALVESDFYNDEGGKNSNLSWILNGPRN